MEYKILFIDVGDADAILISYQENPIAPRRIVLVDAGNVGDSKKIKDCLYRNFRTYKIDCAICTHPDKDHKGGFFGLFEDDDVTIESFYFKAPWEYLNMDDFENVNSEDEALEFAYRIYNHPIDESMNLLVLAWEHCEKRVYSVHDGDQILDIPLKVIGPSEEYFREVALAIVKDFSELTDEADFERYDENAQIDEYDARSVIDEDDDDSPLKKKM